MAYALSGLFIIIATFAMAAMFHSLKGLAASWHKLRSVPEHPTTPRMASGIAWKASFGSVCDANPRPAATRSTGCRVISATPIA